MLSPKCYELLLQFFHSIAWDVDTVLKRWWHIVLQSNTVVKVNDKLVLLADHTKVPKEGRKYQGYPLFIRIQKHPVNLHFFEAIFGELSAF
jgi:hypothetical protein